MIFTNDLRAAMKRRAGFVQFENFVACYFVRVGDLNHPG